MAVPSNPLPDPRLSIHLDYNNIVDAQFLQHVVDDGLGFVRGDMWITDADTDALPGKLLARADYRRAGRLELLVALDRAVAHLVLVDLALHARVAAVDEDACEAAMAALRAATPADSSVEERVPVSFWWLEQHGPQELGRMMPAPSWQDIALNYSSRTQRSLAPMISWDAAPTRGGRLILWQGAPGTGKTTAVRALAREWREWADFQFITDPELFLHTPSYLLGAIAEKRRPVHASRWRVLVLEDSGEFLAPDAKQLAGQALSRLLNVCDGVLGQATRSLVLVTTNEPLRTLHPALARPGRCLAEVEFRELEREEIVRWCNERDIPAPAARTVALADLFAHAEGRTRARPEQQFGFAAAV